MRNQEGKIGLQKKVHRGIFARDITFWLHALLYSMKFSVAFFVFSPPFPNDELAEWPLQRCMIMRYLVFCVMIPWVNSREYDSFLQFNTSWLASLGTWYYFRLFNLSSSDIKLLFVFTKVLIENKNLQTWCW